jgi:hypothetical protein
MPIQYNLDRLRSAPANKNYRKNYDALMCASYGCKSWHLPESKFCHVHRPFHTAQEVAAGDSHVYTRGALGQ